MAAITQKSYKGFIAKCDEYQKAEDAYDGSSEYSFIRNLVDVLANADLTDSGMESDVEAIMSDIGEGKVFLSDMYSMLGASALTIDDVREAVEKLDSARDSFADSNAAYIKSAVVEFLNGSGIALIDYLNAMAPYHRSLPDATCVQPIVNFSYDSKQIGSFPCLPFGYAAFYELAGKCRNRMRGDDKTKSMSDILKIQAKSIATVVDQIDSGIAAMSSCPILRPANNESKSELLRAIVNAQFTEEDDDNVLEDYYLHNSGQEDVADFISRFSNEMVGIYLKQTPLLSDDAKASFAIRSDYLAAAVESLLASTSDESGISPADLMYYIMECDVLFKLLNSDYNSSIFSRDWEDAVNGINGNKLRAIKDNLEQYVKDLKHAHVYANSILDAAIADGRFRRAR